MREAILSAMQEVKGFAHKEGRDIPAVKEQPREATQNAEGARAAAAERVEQPNPSAQGTRPDRRYLSGIPVVNKWRRHPRFRRVAER